MSVTVEFTSAISWQLTGPITKKYQASPNWPPLVLQSALKNLRELIAPQTSDDDRLMAQVAQGDHNAFEKLFSKYSATVLGYCTRLLSDRETAEDISQEVWVKVAKAAPNYQSQGKFKSWLLTTTRNTCFNQLRRPQLELLDSEGDSIGEEADERASIETMLVENHDLELARTLIDKLPENQRTCLVMWMTEELSYQELAEQMKLKLPAVKSLLYRAKQSLVQSFQAHQGVRP